MCVTASVACMMGVWQERINRGLAGLGLGLAGLGVGLCEVGLGLGLWLTRLGDPLGATKLRSKQPVAQTRLDPCQKSGQAEADAYQHSYPLGQRAQSRLGIKYKCWRTFVGSHPSDFLPSFLEKNRP